MSEKNEAGAWIVLDAYAKVRAVHDAHFPTLPALRRVMSDIVRGSWIMATGLGICTGIGLALVGPILLVELLGTLWWLTLYLLDLLVIVWFFGFVCREQL